MKKQDQFKGIYTGLLDINKNPIFEGSILKRGIGLPLSGNAPKKFPPFGYSKKIVIYHDGAFKCIRKKSINSGRRYLLNSLTIRYYGLTIVNSKQPK